MQEDSLLSEPPRKPKNTRMGSLSLLQGNFLTQELNQGLLHCWRILYQLSFLGNPKYKRGGKKPTKENVVSFHHKCVITDALLTALYPLTQRTCHTASDHRFTHAVISSNCSFILPLTQVAPCFWRFTLYLFTFTKFQELLINMWVWVWVCSVASDVFDSVQPHGP